MRGLRSYTAIGLLATAVLLGASGCDSSRAPSYAPVDPLDVEMNVLVIEFTDDLSAGTVDVLAYESYLGDSIAVLHADPSHEYLATLWLPTELVMERVESDVMSPESQPPLFDMDAVVIAVETMTGVDVTGYMQVDSGTFVDISLATDGLHPDGAFLGPDPWGPGTHVVSNIGSDGMLKLRLYMRGLGADRFERIVVSDDPALVEDGLAVIYEEDQLQAAADDLLTPPD